MEYLSSLFADSKLSSGFGIFFIAAVVLVVLFIMIIKMLSRESRTRDILVLSAKALLGVLIMSGGIWIMFNDKSARGLSLILLIGGGLSAIFQLFQIFKPQKEKE